MTRDALEFVEGAEAGRYVARQSVASIFAAPPQESTLAALKVHEDARPMARRATEQDFNKTAISFLNDGLNSPILIDLIDERTGLAITHCGALVTDSQANQFFSNARSLYARRIPAFSDEHMRLFDAALPALATLLADRLVVIHCAYYARGAWSHAKQNASLRQMYTALGQTLRGAAAIEVEEDKRQSSPSHRWGDAPYHYIDAYYRRLVEQLCEIIPNIGLRHGASMQVDQESPADTSPKNAKGAEGEQPPRPSLGKP